MKQSNFYRLRFLVNFVFILLAIIIPLVVTKAYEGYDLEILERVQIWLLIDGLILILQAITNTFIKTLPIYPDFIPMPPKDKGDNNGQ